MFGLCNIFSLLIIYGLIILTVQQLRDPTFMETFNRYRRECAKEGNIEPSFLVKAMSEDNLPADNIFKCFSKCLHEKIGVIDKNGTIIIGELDKVSAQLVNDATRQEILEKCGSIRTDDPCETGFLLMACIRKAELDHE